MKNDATNPLVAVLLVERDRLFTLRREGADLAAIAYQVHVIKRLIREIEGPLFSIERHDTTCAAVSVVFSQTQGRFVYITEGEQ